MRPCGGRALAWSSSARRNGAVSWAGRSAAAEGSRCVWQASSVRACADVAARGGTALAMPPGVALPFSLRLLVRLGRHRQYANRTTKLRTTCEHNLGTHTPVDANQKKN